MKSREKMKDILQKPENWNQGSLWRSRNGSPMHTIWTEPESLECQSFCITGAMYYCYPNEAERESARGKITVEIRKMTLASQEGFTDEFSLSSWNDMDCRTHAQVLGVLEAADV